MESLLYANIDSLDPVNTKTSKISRDHLEASITRLHKKIDDFLKFRVCETHTSTPKEGLINLHNT